MSALQQQVAGDHYKSLKIQPIEFIHATGIPFAEGCAIKYLVRWRECHRARSPDLSPIHCTSPPRAGFFMGQGNLKG